MTRIAVVSSVYGGYDAPVAPTSQSMECSFTLVSDRDYDCPPWNVVVEPRPQLHPRLAAKVAKCRPDLFVEADVYVWVDASFVINNPDFVEWVVGHLNGSPIGQIPHPDRSRIYDEAEISAAMPKYSGLPVREQVKHYIARGFPDGNGLWATGLIAYRRGDWLKEFGDAWLREQMRWTYQDQLSEVVVLWELGLKPSDIPARLIGDSHFGIRGHATEL